MIEAWGLDADQLDLLQVMGIRLWQQRVDLPDFPVEPYFWPKQESVGVAESVVSRVPKAPLVVPDARVLPHAQQSPVRERTETQPVSSPVAVSEQDTVPVMQATSSLPATHALKQVRLLLAALGPEWLVIGCQEATHPWPNSLHLFLQDIALWLEPDHANLDVLEFVIPDGIPPGVTGDIESLRSWVQGGWLRMAKNRRVLMFSGADVWMPALAQQSRTVLIALDLLECMSSTSAKRQFYGKLLSCITFVP